MNKYEQLIESILNEDEQAARALFHDIVVAKSREIYESLMDEEMGGNASQGFVQDITNQNDQAQDMGLGEDDMEGGDIELDGGDMDGEEFGDEETFGGDGEMGMGGEHGEHEEITSKLDDLEAQLAELKAMLGDEGAEHGEDFSDVEGGEAGESDFDMDGGEEHTSGSGSAEADEGMMETMGSGMSGSGMSGSGKSGSGKMESANPFAKSGSGKSGSGTSMGKSGSGKSGSGKMESVTRRKSEVEIMKEYVDKIGEIYKQEPASGEGKTVGTGGDEPTINHKSIEGPGADFGGTNENIVSGKGDNANPDGKAFKAPSNEYTKGRGDLPGAGQFKNVPGGNAGKTAFKTKEPGHGAEKKSGPEGKLVGADGSRPVNKTSVQKQNTGAK